ncbi:MAG TPA: MFS transporter [Vicinamibacterales bacterium]|nr:MFS transporter [Vicinamibacterales bacterium]
MNSTLPAGVWLLGGVSLFNDIASEAIYPLLPFFLTSVLGATAVSLGFIEGAAEAISSVLKVISGRMSDRWRRRKPIVLGGYSLSALARPFISVANGWVAVFALRFIDRVGKGIRSAPRDAMLADLAEVTNRGRVFGFHRAMDHAGAVLGPLLATGFLIAFPDRYRTLFALTAIPGIATVVLLLWLKEPAPGSWLRAPSLQPLVPTHQSLPPPLVRYLIVLSIFTLGNSADAFLLLRLTQAAGGPQYIPLMWALLHVVKMGSSVIGGSASDRVGRRPLIAIGWVIYAGVYAGFALSESLVALIACFLIYGVYYGCVEGTERALVADFAPATQKGTAFGVYNAVAGIGALVSSVVFGMIWKYLGAATAFASGATLALLAAILLFALVPAPEPRTER